MRTSIYQWSARDEEETIVMTRKNGEETIAMIFNCSTEMKEFNEYAQKHNLITDSGNPALAYRKILC